MRRNTKVKDKPRVEFLHDFIGALLDAVRYAYLTASSDFNAFGFELIEDCAF